jgi:hypothetical protein
MYLYKYKYKVNVYYILCITAVITNVITYIISYVFLRVSHEIAFVKYFCKNILVDLMQSLCYNSVIATIMLLILLRSTMQIKKIETYSLYEFCQTVEQSVTEGWRFDFNSNELFPTMFGSMLVAGMVKAEDVVVQDNTEETPVVNTEVKRGRKPKE